MASSSAFAGRLYGSAVSGASAGRRVADPWFPASTVAAPALSHAAARSARWSDPSTFVEEKFRNSEISSEPKRSLTILKSDR